MLRFKNNRVRWSWRRWRALRKPPLWPYVAIIVAAAIIMIIARLLL